MESNKKMKLEIQKFSSGPGDNSTMTIGDVTYGVSQSGVMEIYNTIHSYIVTEAEQAINDTANLEQVFRDNWSGSDEIVFVNNLKALGVKILDALQEYDVAIKNEFTTIVQSWNDFQASNVTER